MSSPLPEEPIFYKPTEAANLLSVSYPTLKKMIKSGKIRSQLTDGGHHRIPRTEIVRLQTLGQKAETVTALLSPEEEIFVLLVEDMPDYQDVLKALLEKKGFRVDVADNIETALLSLSKHTPDVIVTDLYSREEKKIIGIDLMRIVRSRPSWAEVRIIVLSGYTASGESYRLEAMEAGADMILNKPEGFFELPDAIIQVLSRD